MENSSLWHYMFRSVVRISVQGGSGHCVMLSRVSQPAAARRNEPDIIINVRRSSCKVPVILVRF
jgi:hypothetical protein